jgi:hypothetical protein
MDKRPLRKDPPLSPYRRYEKKGHTISHNSAATPLDQGRRQGQSGIWSPCTAARSARAASHWHCKNLWATRVMTSTRPVQGQSLIMFMTLRAAPRAPATRHWSASSACSTAAEGRGGMHDDIVAEYVALPHPPKSVHL